MERSIAIYIDSEDKTLDGLLARCLMVFTLAIDMAIKEVARGDISLPKHLKTTAQAGQELPGGVAGRSRHMGN